MEELKYFHREDERYVLKHNVSRILILTAICIAGGMFLLLRGQILLGALLVVFSVIIASRLAGRISFDNRQKTVTAKQGLFDKERIFSFADFTGFTMTKTKSSGITTNTELKMNFNSDGKEKSVLLRQAGRGTKYADKITEEIEWIMQQSK